MKINVYDMNKDELIDYILPEKVTAGEVFDLLYDLKTGITVKSIKTAECDSIYAMDIYKVIEELENTEYWKLSLMYTIYQDKGIKCMAVFEECMKDVLCDQVDAFEVVERDQSIYEDIIYVALENMTTEDLVEYINTYRRDYDE